MNLSPARLGLCRATGFHCILIAGHVNHHSLLNYEYEIRSTMPYGCCPAKRMLH